MDRPRPEPGGLKRGQFVVFDVDEKHYALPLEDVVRALRMVAVTPVPDVPPWVVGVINMAGDILPVVDLRPLFGLTPKAIELSDRLLVVCTQGQQVAVRVDAASSVMERHAAEIEPPPPALQHAHPVAGMLRRDDDLVLLLDTPRLLPPEQNWELPAVAATATT